MLPKIVRTFHCLNKLFYWYQKFCEFSGFSLEFQKFFSITRTIFLTVDQNNFGNKIPYLYIRDGKFANAKSWWQYCALESATSWNSLILVERGLWDLAEYPFNRGLNRGNPWRSSDDFHSINLILFPFRSLQTINHNLLRKWCRCKLTRFFLVKINSIKQYNDTKLYPVILRAFHASLT